MPDQVLTTIATQLATIICTQRGIEFTRSVSVTEDAPGDIDVSKTSIFIHPLFFTAGDPIATMNHVIDVCIEFDQKLDRAHRRYVSDLKLQFRASLRNLLRFDPDLVREIFEEEVSTFTDEEILVLEITDETMQG